MIRRTISSVDTFVFKIIVPIIWIGGFSFTTFQLFSGSDPFTDTPGSPTPFDFLALTVVGAGFLYWTRHFKRVDIDDTALHISNYRQEITVPFRDIEEVSENRWLGIHPVTVHFRRDTDFGTSIVFMPKTRWFPFFSSHPIVSELRAAASRARGGDPDASAA